jgi:hypothetical protein
MTKPKPKTVTPKEKESKFTVICFAYESVSFCENEKELEDYLNDLAENGLPIFTPDGEIIEDSILIYKGHLRTANIKFEPHYKIRGVIL